MQHVNNNTINKFVEMLGQKTCILGGGISGALTAYILSRNMKIFIPLNLHIWTTEIGGRMLTKTHPKFKDLTCDIGAQYFTTQMENETSKPFYDILQKEGIIHKYTENISGLMHEQSLTHFVAKNGTNSVVEFFIERAKSNGLKTVTVEKVKRIEVSQDEIIISNFNKFEKFTSLIITIPIPNLFEIEGNISQLISPKFNILNEVKYSKRFAIALFYLEKIHFQNAMTYIKDHPFIRFISVDTQKRGFSHQNGTTILIHTSAPFGLEHSNSSEEDVKRIVLNEFRNIYPRLSTPDYTYCHKWEISQAIKTLRNPVNDFSMVLCEKPLVILGGDIFTQSGLNGCILSAISACDKMQDFASK